MRKPPTSHVRAEVNNLMYVRITYCENLAGDLLERTKARSELFSPKNYIGS